MSLKYRWLFVFWLAASTAASHPITLQAGVLGSPAASTTPSRISSQPHAAGPPNVILITLDTTRADRMGFLGSQRGLTPNLDALARQSVVFTHAYSQVPITTSSHATILTGTYPQFHKISDFGIPLRQDLPYASSIFKQRGYHTAAFVGSLVLDPQTRSAPGFDRGFDTFDAGYRRRHAGESRYSTIERRGGEVVAHALAWLNQHPRGPFFLWVHLYDAHDPYDPPEPFKTKYASAPYDGEIAYVDSAVGKLLAQLRVRGLYDGALIAVMADHGEALGEHGEATHGVFLYDETIHVPLLFKFPQQNAKGERIEGRAQLVDVLPTLLQAAKVAIPAQVQGQSLLPMLKGPARTSSGPTVAPERAAYSESDYPQHTFGWSSLRALRTGKYLFIDAPRQELYDQAADPKAEHNLASTSGAVASTLASQLEAFRQKTASAGEAPALAEDPELQQKLAALGYIAGSTSTSLGIQQSGADPKDKVEVVNLLHEAEIAKEEMQFQKAVPLLEKVVTLEPHLPIAYLQLGTALTALKQYEKAIPILRNAVEMRQDLIVPRYQLASALFETGDFAGAALELETVVTRSPGWGEARFLLATTYARQDRMPDAIKEYQKVIALRPNHYGAHLLLGRALSLQGDQNAALPELNKAASLQPQSPEPHRFLADAYTQLGRTADATREHQKADRLKPIQR